MMVQLIYKPVFKKISAQRPIVGGIRKAQHKFNEMHAVEEPGLLIAARRGALQTAKQLIDQGADINEINDSNNFCALNAACWYGEPIIVSLLLESGADLELTNTEGESCLTDMRLFVLPKLECLVKGGARVNRMCADGGTALHHQALMDENNSSELLLKNGAIMRQDRNGHSPIISAAVWNQKQMVQFLSEFTDNGNISTFERRSNQSRDMPSPFIDLADKIDAYKLLGACYVLQYSEDTRNAWSNALSIYDRSIIRPKQHDNRSLSCVCRTRMNTKEGKDCEELFKSVEAWSEVNLAAQEMITGSEMLQNCTKPNELIWMSDFLPHFSCPTSPPGRHICSAVNRSVSQTKQYHLPDKTYLVKWPHLQRELHSLYSGRVVIERFHSQTCTTTVTQSLSSGKFAPISEACSGVDGKSYMRGDRPFTFNLPTNDGVFLKPSPVADVSLGIEPVCFVPTRYHLKDVDPKSYYLQRQWLLSGRLIHPRTRYRCFYRLCTVCGHIVIQFGGVYPKNQSRGFKLSMSDLVCQRCRLTFPETGNQLFALSKRSVTKRGYRLYRNSAPLTCNLLVGELAGNVNKQTSDLKFCAHCGLVSEQHPLLNRLRQCIEEAFGHVRELTSKEELTDIMNNSNAVVTQKIMILSRTKGMNVHDEILHVVQNYTRTTDITTSEKLWRYAFQFAKIFHLQHQPLHVQSHFQTFAILASRVFREKKDVSIHSTLVTDCLELLIDVIKGRLEKSFYRRDEKYLKMSNSRTVNSLIQCSIRLISPVLFFHLRQLPFSKSPLHDQCLIDLLVKQYCQDINSENAQFHSSRVLNKLTQTADDSGSNEGTGREQLIISPVDTHRFISQVYRLICLVSRFSNDTSLLHVACSMFLGDFGDQILYSHIEMHVNILTIELLLRLGADPNCVNVDGETLVGYLLKKSGQEEGKAHHLLAILMKAGAHLDAYKRLPDGEDQDESLRNFLTQHNICPVRNRKLTCLVATAMRRNGLTSRLAGVKTFLPLLTFIHLH